MKNIQFRLYVCAMIIITLIILTNFKNDMVDEELHYCISDIKQTYKVALVMISDEDVDDLDPQHHSKIYLQSLSNKRSYAERHGYDIILDTQIDYDRNIVWAKLVALYSAMSARKDID